MQNVYGDNNGSKNIYNNNKFLVLHYAMIFTSSGVIAKLGPLGP